MSALFCLEFSGDLTPALQWLRSEKGGRLLVLRPELESELKKRGDLDYEMLPTGLEEDEHLELNILSRSLWSQWVVESGELAGFYGIQLTAFIFWALRQAVLLDSFFKKHAVSKVAFIDRWNVSGSAGPSSSQTIAAVLLKQAAHKWGFELQPIEPASRVPGKMEPPTLKAKRAVARLFYGFVRPVPRKKERAVLFSGAVRVMGPLMKELAARGKRVILLRPRFEAQSLGVLGTVSSVSFESESRRFALGEIKGGPEIKASGPCFFREMVDLRSVIDAKAAYLSRAAYPKLRRDFDVLKSLFAAHEVERVIVDEDVTEFNKNVVRAARSLDIKSVVCQHGLPGDAVGFTPLSADYFLSWGPHSTERLRAWGTRDEQMIEVGSPRYDALMEKGAHPKATPGASTLLVLPKLRSFGSPGRSSNEHVTLAYSEKVLRAAAEALRKLPAASLLVKPHPGESDLRGIRAALQSCGNGLRWRLLPALASASDFMDSCSLVAGVESGAMVEALILGVPSVCINFSGKPYVYDLVHDGISLGAGSSQALPGVFAKALSPQYREMFLSNRQALLDRYFSTTAADASKKAADFILLPKEQYVSA